MQQMEEAFEKVISELLPKNVIRKQIKNPHVRIQHSNVFLMSLNVILNLAISEDELFFFICYIFRSIKVGCYN